MEYQTISTPYAARRRYVLIALCVIVFVVVLFIVFHKPRVKPAPIYKASATASNIQFPYLANSDTIDFFTGSNFAAYSVSSGSTAAVSPQFILPTVSAMKWSSGGVLFKANGYTVADDLYQVLLNKFQLTSGSYWWLYDFKSQQLSLVMANNPSDVVVDVAWDSSSPRYAYLTTNKLIYLSSNPGKPVYKVNGTASLIGFNGNVLTIQDSSGLKQVNVNTGADKYLVRGYVSRAYVSADGQTVAYVLGAISKNGGDSPGTLYVYNPTSGKSKKVLSDFEGVMGGSGGNLYIGYQDSGGAVHFEYYPVKGQALSYSLGAIVNRNASIGAIMPLDTGTVFVDSSSNDLVKASTRPANVHNPINNTYLIDGDYYLSGYEIHFSPHQNNYEIDIDQNPFVQFQSDALDYIKSKGIDPNQIVIVWRANDGVDKTNPHVVDGAAFGTINGNE